MADNETPTAESHGEAVQAILDGLVGDGHDVRPPTTFVFTEDGFMVIGPSHDDEGDDAILAKLLTLAAANIAVAHDYHFENEATRDDMFVGVVRHIRQAAAESLAQQGQDGSRAQA